MRKTTNMKMSILARALPIILASPHSDTQAKTLIRHIWPIKRPIAESDNRVEIPGADPFKPRRTDGLSSNLDACASYGCVGAGGDKGGCRRLHMVGLTVGHSRRTVLAISSFAGVAGVRGLGAALLGRFLPKLKAPGFIMAGASFSGHTCITGIWPISPSLLGKFPRAH